MKTLLLFLLLLGVGRADSGYLFGNPKERTIWVPKNFTPVGMTLQQVGFTGSMRPTFKGGEYYWAELYAGQSDLVGCIVVYQRDGQLIIHRVVAETKKAVRIAGDANAFTDGWFPKTDILFIVRYVLRD